MKVNAESIYDSEKIPNPGNPIGDFFGGIIGTTAAKEKNLYWHIFRWPGEPASMPGIKKRYSIIKSDRYPGYYQ